MLAFYDGRVPGSRFAPGPNWVDDGALSLGIASYAIFDGDAALVYDTHVSTDHARIIRQTLENMGISRFTVVLSHHHLDHVAGTEVFDGASIIANRRTADHLSRRKAAIEAGTHKGAPGINPLILPTQVFENRAHLHIGGLHIDLIAANIHSDDATLVWMARPRLLLAGDAIEDPITYVGAPQDFDIHLTELDRLAALNPQRILPNHGDPDIIAAGGYGPDIIPATQRYIRHLQASRDDKARREMPLQQVLAADLAAGTLKYFAEYEAVHRANLAAVLA